MVNLTPNPIKEYYIAYFDILGYKAFFEEQSEKVPELLGSIHDAIQRTKNHIGAANGSPILNGTGNIDIHVKVFSDNILLCMEATSSPFEQARILAFFQIVSDIQRGFVTEYGLFVRGGILKGELSFNDDYVFGKGLIDVVTIEEKRAIYPRIIITAELMTLLQGNPFFTDEEYTRAAEIRQRMENKQSITTDEQAFCCQMNMKTIMLQMLDRAKESLTMQWPDENWILCYLHKPMGIFPFGDGAKESLLQMIQAVSPYDYNLASQPPVDFDTVLRLHKERVEEQLRKFGNNSGIPTEDVKAAELQEKTLRKYIWVMAFHNHVCEASQKQQYKIFTNCNCDTRFLKMTIEVQSNEVGV